MKYTLIIMAVMLAPALANAVPDVDDVTGDVTHGDTLTIAGSGFGTKATARPFAWDDFEDGVDDDPLDSDDLSWDNANGPPHDMETTKYSDDFQRISGGLSSYQEGSGRSWYYASLPATVTTGTEVYFSGWFYGTSNVQSISEKFLIITEYNWCCPEIRLHGAGYYSIDTEGCDDSTGSPIATNDGYTFPDPYDRGIWVRYETYIKFGSSGNFSVWLNGVEYLDYDGDFSYSGCLSDIDTYYITSQYNVSDSNNHWSKSYWDEIYIDDTRARVEIGNASTWAACTHKEIQIPTSWSATSITVDVNAGTFVTDDAAYIYVVDEDGAVNAAGYAVTIGTGAGGTGGITVDPTDLTVTGGN